MTPETAIGLALGWGLWTLATWARPAVLALAALLVALPRPTLRGLGTLTEVRWSMKDSARAMPSTSRRSSGCVSSQTASKRLSMSFIDRSRASSGGRSRRVCSG